MTTHARLSPMKSAVAALAVAAMTSAPAAAADWTEYRGPAGDGRSADVGVAKHFAGKPKLVWKAPIGQGFGTFAVAGDKAYVFVDNNSRETLTCFDANTGKQLWATPVDQTMTEERQGGPNPRSTPTIDGDKVYVFSAYFKLACLSAANGKVLWETTVAPNKGADNGGDIKSWGNAASPVLEGDKIFVAGGGSGKSMAAVDKATGKVVWETGSEKVTHASPVTATIHGVPQVIYFMKSGLVSLAQADGKELWRQPFKFSVSTAASPVVGSGADADVVYCSAGYGVGTGAYQISKDGDAFSAKELWFQPSEGKAGSNVHHWSTPIYHDGHVYGIFGFKDYAGGKDATKGGPVGCVEMRTGKVKWKQPGFGSGGGTIFVDGHILVQGDAGRLSLIEATPTAFKEKVSWPIPGEKFWCAAVVANGKVYTRSKTEAFCIDVSK